jgi:iron complex transport system ATP-binding protein
MIQIDNLTFGYTDAAVLKDISLSIAAGERWAVIGRNGVGKSTLIRCIAGLVQGDSGTVKVREKDVAAYSPRARARIIAYVPQAQGLRIPFTVYEYVMMGRFPYQGFMASASDEDVRFVNETLALTDTVSLKDRPMHTLSGGEQQRVLLAGAVSQHTEILLLDEPATFLDPLHQELIQQTLDRIHKEYHCTILTVTHDINNALYRYDNICALVEGRVYYAGTAVQLLQQYTTALKDIYGIPFVIGSIEGNSRTFVLPVSGD